MLYQDTVILVFSKAPVEGQVNTRLIPDIGVEAATQLQYDLLHQRLQMLSAADLCAVKLMCSPNKVHECFVECEANYPVTLSEQVGNDLGERLVNGVELALKEYKFCIVIGTDAPALDAEVIKQAIETLQGNVDVVFIPAEDGGYVLVGMKYNHQCLFENISWGNATVLQQSLAALSNSKISYQALKTLWDVDRIEDYRRYLALK